jgi:hyperosmotically inducible protein
MTIDTSRTLATALCTVAAAVALVACDRPAQDPNAARQSDATVAQAERKAAEVGADVRAAGSDAKQATGEAVDSMANKVGDAAITTMINTVDGRVTLRGDAPNANARDRATTLAQRVDGVKSVDNQLNIKANS